MADKHPFYGVRISKLSKSEIEKYPDLYTDLILQNKNASSMIMHWMTKAMTVVYNNQEVDDDLFSSSSLQNFFKKHKKFHACLCLVKEALSEKTFYESSGEDYLNQPVNLPKKLAFMQLPETMKPSGFAKEIIKLGNNFYPERENREYPLMKQLGQYLDYRFDQRKRSIDAWIMIDNTHGIVSRKDVKKPNQRSLLDMLYCAEKNNNDSDLRFFSSVKLKK